MRRGGGRSPAAPGSRSREGPRRGGEILGDVCVVIYNTLKFIESFKVISLFSYQGSLFCCRSRRQLVHFILSSLFCQELFYFILSKVFSFEQLVYINSFLSLCQELFELIIQASGEGGI